MDRLILLKSRTLGRLFGLLPLAILLLAVVLRFHLIDHQSLWNDEGNTLRLVERDIPALVENAARDIHPPGYYLLLKGWWLLTGSSEFALRVFSALAGMLTVACVYALGRALYATGAGTIAALLVALNTFNLYYSQEARMYALLALWASAAMLVFIRWMDRPSWRLVIALAFLNAAGLYTQYVYPFVMVAQGWLFLWRLAVRRDQTLLAEYLALNLLTILLFAPQLGTALHQVTTWPRTGKSVELLTGLATVAQWLIYGNTANGLTSAAYLWPVLFFLAALLPDWRYPGWWRRLVPVTWLLVSVGPLFGLGLFREANLKFLLPAQVAAAILIARGIWLLWEFGSANAAILIETLPRLLAGFGLLSILSFSGEALDNLYHNTAYARSDYRAVVARIATDPRPGDAIILDAPNQWEVFTYYYHGEAPIFPLPEGLGGDDAKTAQSVTTITGKYRRIFVLYWGDVERDPQQIVEKTLADHAFEVASNWYGDVRFVQYATLPNSAGERLTPNARFGASITLNSVTLSNRTVLPGDVLGVTLQWSTSQPLFARYKVFLQLLNAQGVLVAQHDGEPGNNMALTTTWEPGKPVADTHGLLVPVSLPEGDYSLIAGLYDLNDPSQRLPVENQDHLDLGMIRVGR